MKKFLILLGMALLGLGLIACSPQASGDTSPQNTDPTTPDDSTTNQDVNGQNQESNQGDTDSTNVQVVEVEAYQFGWDPNPIRVEAGRPVRLELSSRDVPHGISIPELGVSKQIPGSGETVTAEFTPERTGEYNFICNVLCGQGHSAMTGTLIVE